ncbi:MAG: hypothetical protein NPIRA05_00810 [Nitrospirales bacterium]|nr:MAG: hypothetical protein NPIRA05_00810 [Nitrospirales bacterium]
MTIEAVPQQKLQVSTEPDGYRFEWPHWNLTACVTRLSDKSGGLGGELAIWITQEGKDRLLTSGQTNLSSIQTRERLVKRLDTLRPGLEWNRVIETVCVRTCELHRQGPPPESLEPSDDDTPATFILNPLIYHRHPTLLYGPGESGKSFFALYLACLLSSGGRSTNLAVAPGGHNCLYLDWELRSQEGRSRVKQLREGHPELTRAPLHLAMHRPLVQVAPELRRTITDHDIDVVIVDSLGPATGGEIERSSDPVAFFNALSSLNVTSLLISHVAKPGEEGKSRSPYGSVYYYNLSRSIWEVRLASEPDSDQRVIALYHRKNNLGRRLAPMGYTLNINDHAALFEPCDPNQEPELAQGISIRERIARLLKDHQTRTVSDIADALGLEAEAVRRTLNRYKGKGWVAVSSGMGRGHESEWGIL